jgi:hyperosmotically inducible periplasmic protein
MKYLMPALLVVLLSSCGNSDKKVAENVNAKVSANNPNISATVADGVVTLTGTCPDEPCKSSSEAAAKDVKGVKQVVNQIQVAAPAAPEPTITINPDDSLRTAVNEAIKDYKNVKAEVRDGVVTLTGEIKRSQLSELMQDVTAAKPKKIENKMQIK